MIGLISRCFLFVQIRGNVLCSCGFKSGFVADLLDGPALVKPVCWSTVSRPAEFIVNAEDDELKKNSLGPRSFLYDSSERANKKTKLWTLVEGFMPFMSMVSLVVHLLLCWFFFFSSVFFAAAFLFVLFVAD